MPAYLRPLAILGFLLTSASAQLPASAPTSPAPARPRGPCHSSLMPPEAVPQEQMRALLLRVAENDLQNQRRQRDYTFVRRQEEHRLDSHGQILKTESRTSEVFQLYGEPVERLIKKRR